MYRDFSNSSVQGQLPTLHVSTPNKSEFSGLDRVDLCLKRVVDVLGATALLIVLAPLMAILAASVAIAIGRPVLFGHVRVGRAGKPFKCWKFRSMLPDAERQLMRLFADNPEAKAEWERTRKLSDDPRITKFGKALRKSSLDELPQLWNVLRGDMSLVGPRPVVREELDQHYGSASAHYLSLRPGITGLWQVSGRNDVSYEARVSLDKKYVEQWSCSEDVRILLRTVKVVLRATGR